MSAIVRVALAYGFGKREIGRMIEIATAARVDDLVLAALIAEAIAAENAHYPPFCRLADER